MKRLIISEWFSSENIKNNYIEVFKNPTSKEWNETYKLNNNIRGIFNEKGDIYITTGELTHDVMVNQLKVPDAIHFEGGDKNKIIIRPTEDDYVEQCKTLFENCKSLFNFYTKNTKVGFEGLDAREDLTIKDYMENPGKDMIYNEDGSFNIEFIKENKNKINSNTWNNISFYEKLSEDFIREFQDKVDWGNICLKQSLSEDFIREFQDKVDWGNISYMQKLSEDFIREFQDKLYLKGLKNNSKINLSEEFKEEFKDKLASVSRLRKIIIKTVYNVK